jgi:hypothetical protein
VKQFQDESSKVEFQDVKQFQDIESSRIKCQDVKQFQDWKKFQDGSSRCKTVLGWKCGT